MALANPVASQGNLRSTTSELSSGDRWDHFLARAGIRRGKHRIQPGLYTLGRPGPESPVFVSANYTLSFDALRSNLAGMDAYILVLNTHGVNVWCAAGKGSFGTAEIIKRVMDNRLDGIVNHRRLIVPQLGAPGVAAHEVKKATGFNVEYGPVRAADLPEYLKTHKATPEMRQVRFTIVDRLVLVPVEITHILPILLVAMVVFYLMAGITSALAVFTAVFSGLVLFPVLLPWLPTQDFSSKGYILGLLAAAPFAAAAFVQNPDWDWRRQALQAFGCLLLMPAVTAFLSLNFTGSTTFTSRIGVRREINSYIRWIAGAFIAGLLLTILSLIIH